jgi:hypothetical protein
VGEGVGEALGDAPREGLIGSPLWGRDSARGCRSWWY